MLKDTSRRIKRERERLNLSQTDLAKKLDVAPQTVNGWEGARRVPDPHMIVVLADLFDVSTDYLLCRTDIRSASILEQTVDNKNIKIELDKNYFKTLTPLDVEKMIQELQAVGFDLNKLL